MRKVKSLTSFIFGTHIKKGDEFNLYSLDEVLDLDKKNEKAYKTQEKLAEGFAKCSHGNSIIAQFSPVYKGECV